MNERNTKKRAAISEEVEWIKCQSQKLDALRPCACVFLLARVHVCVQVCKGNIMCVSACVHAYTWACVCLSERQVMTKVVDSCQCTWVQDGRRALVSVNTLLWLCPELRADYAQDPLKDKQRPLVPLRVSSSQCKCKTKRRGFSAIMSTSWRFCRISLTGLFALSMKSGLTHRRSGDWSRAKGFTSYGEPFRVMEGAHHRTLAFG